MLSLVIYFCTRNFVLVFCPIEEKVIARSYPVFIQTIICYLCWRGFTIRLVSVDINGRWRVETTSHSGRSSFLLLCEQLSKLVPAGSCSEPMHLLLQDISEELAGNEGFPMHLRSQGSTSNEGNEEPVSTWSNLGSDKPNVLVLIFLYVLQGEYTVNTLDVYGHSIFRRLWPLYVLMKKNEVSEFSSIIFWYHCCPWD